LKKCLLGEAAQRLGKGCLLSVFEHMNSFHKDSVIYSKGPRFSEILLFKKAFRTSVIFSVPGDKGEAAF
jgi:hypothetical protein